MIRRALVAVTLLVSVSRCFAGETFDATQRGKACRPDELGQMTCDYTVGVDLVFSVVALGTPGEGLTVFKSDWNGDYYLSFGLAHQCAIVKPGASRRPKAPGFSDLAFVSMRTGKVYVDWPSCKGDR